MRAADSGPIGLLGGSFDPVHAGHLQLASAAQAALGLGQLRFVPAGRPWQKGAVTPAADRVRMLELALQGKPGWCLDTREIERPGPSYSVDTLRQLRDEYGPERPLVWVLGFDQLRQLASWHRWQELTSLAHLAYTQRAGSSGSLDPAMRGYVEQRRGIAADLQHRASGTIVEFAMRPIDCSSTQIRRWLAAGDLAAAARYLPEPVLDYVRTHHTYSAPHGK
jgi:nicotinate-nucleotide adenylyltransferase